MPQRADREITGLRDVRGYKVYYSKRDQSYHASHKQFRHIRRVKLQNRETAEAIASYKEADFVLNIEQLLEGAKRSGSINYFETGKGK